jgi:hypothetical protein
MEKQSWVPFFGSFLGKQKRTRVWGGTPYILEYFFLCLSGGITLESFPNKAFECKEKNLLLKYKQRSMHSFDHQRK